MTYLEALEILAADPHCWRYRELTADEYPNARTRDAWRAQVIVMAGGPPPARPPAATPVRRAPPRDAWLPLIRGCPDYNPGCCAHPAPFCSRYGRDTTRQQCVDCLTADGITPGEPAT